jgi:hypothetical protein
MILKVFLSRFINYFKYIIGCSSRSKTNPDKPILQTAISLLPMTDTPMMKPMIFLEGAKLLYHAFLQHGAKSAAP